MSSEQFWQSPGELETLIPNYHQDIHRKTPRRTLSSKTNDVPNENEIGDDHDLSMDALLDSNKLINRLKITINQYEKVEDYVVYKVEVQKDDFKWLVLRRYSGFHKLHEELVEKYSISWKLLPSKKVFGSKRLSLVMARMSLLEKYLQGLVGLWEELPRMLVEFLELDQFDIVSVCRTLSRDLWEIGDTLLRKNSTFKVTPHQIYCINRRLHLPIPTSGPGNPSEDIGHLYSFIQQVKNILIYPGEERQFYMSSGDFTFDLSVFRSLEYLETQRIDTEGLNGIEAIQETVKEIKARRTVQLLKDLLISNESWSHGLLIAVDSNQESINDITKRFSSWKHVEKACFSHNALKFIDYSILLLPNLRVLNLSHNLLSCIQFLEELTFLEELDLSYNEIQDVKDFYLLVPSVSKLNLAGNLLTNVKGLERLFSLEVLDVSNNLIEQIEKVLPLGQLPLLNQLWIQGNVFTSSNTHYKTLLLTQFGYRFVDILLDGKTCTQKEKKKVMASIAALENYVVISSEEFAEKIEQSTPTRYSINDDNSIEKSTPRRYSKDVDKNVKQSTPRHHSKDANKSPDVLSVKTEHPAKHTASPRPRKKIVDIKPPRNQNKDKSKSKEELDEIDFRSKVEQLKNAGGDDWLSLYNDTIKQERDNIEVETNEAPQHNNIEGETAKLPHPNNEAKVTSEDLLQNKNQEYSSHHREHISKPDKNMKQSRQTISNKEVAMDKSEFLNKSRVTSLLTENGKPMFHRTLSNEEIDTELNEEMRRAVRELLESTTDVQDETFLFMNVKEKKEVMWALSDDILMEIFIDNGVIKSKYMLKSVRGLNVLCEDDEYFFQFEAEPFIAGNEEPVYELVKISTTSVKDAAGLYTLLKPYNTGRATRYDSERDHVTRHDSTAALQDISSFLTTFLNETQNTKILIDSHKNTSTENSNYANINIGHTFYRHAPESESHVIKQSILTGCIPYLFSDEEIPCYIVITELNVFLLRTLPNIELNMNAHAHYKNEKNSFICFYSFSLKNIKEIVIGLFDQCLRIESRDEGPRGTFLFLTRDMMKTSKILEAIKTQCNKFNHTVSIVYPTENNVNALSWQLEQQDMIPLGSRENLMSYYVIYELTKSCNDSYEGSTVPNLRSLILTNRRLLLCDEDYIHWPLPSFVRTPPLTPQWVIVDKHDVEALIGVDIWKEYTGEKTVMGANGITLNFERNSNVRIGSGHTWELVFSSLTERDQFVRSLACLWKNTFDEDLKITHSNILSGYLTHTATSSDDINVKNVESPQTLLQLDQHQINVMFRDAIAHGADKDIPNINFLAALNCVPFNFPTVEIDCVLLLGNQYIYLLFTNRDKKYFDNSQINQLKSEIDLSFICFPIRSLYSLIVGLFDQCFRLETDSPTQTFVCVTRNSDVTNDFMQRLSQVILNLPEENELGANINVTPVNRSATKIFQMYRMEDNAVSEFTHPNSRILFTYPGDDTLVKLKYEISEYLKTNQILPDIQDDFGVLLYAFIYQTTAEAELNNTFVISEKFICLIKEDNVNYPLAHFVKERPVSKQYQIISAQLMVSLLNVEFNDFHSGVFTLNFNSRAVDPAHYEERFRTKSVESDDACLVTDVNQVTSLTPDTASLSDCNQEALSEKSDYIIKWNLKASSREEREKIFNILSRVWSMMFPEKSLSIIHKEK